MQKSAIADPLKPLLPEFRANPYPMFARMRREAPIMWGENSQSWYISKYSDVQSISRDLHYGKEFTPFRQVNPLICMLPPVKEMIEARTAFMLNQDPPDHTRLRALVNKAFTPSMVAGMRPHIQNITDRLLDAVEDKGGVDLVEQFAFPLPVTVIAEMLGVPAEDRELFKGWSRPMAEMLEPGDAAISTKAHAAKALHELLGYLKPLIEKRRRDPRQDLISALVQAEEQGQKLSGDEVIGNVVLLLVAGHETTVSLISNGIYNLLRHPDQLALLKEKPDLITTAVDELLRYDSPVQLTRRQASEDVDVGGQQIKAGQMLVLLLGSANRDPEQFADPDSLDITRTDNKHLSFGTGIHHCLGAALAEAEGQIAIATILRRFSKIKLTADEKDIVYKMPFALRGPVELPVKLA